MTRLFYFGPTPYSSSSFYSSWSSLTIVHSSSPHKVLSFYTVTGVNVLTVPSFLSSGIQFFCLFGHWSYFRSDHYPCSRSVLLFLKETLRTLRTVTSWYDPSLSSSLGLPPYPNYPKISKQKERQNCTIFTFLII